MPSFDVVSEIDQHELVNAIDQANREISNRFDFKGTNSKVELSEQTLLVISKSEFQVKQINDILKNKKFLFGDRPLETDWKLFTTLIRFDAVYYYHFKCNIKKLVDYENIIKYLQRLTYYPKVEETIKLNHIIDHYYLSHLKINPQGIIPKGSPKTINQVINL